MKTRVIVYARSEDGQSFERRLTLPFPPFVGAHLWLVVGGSIVGFQVEVIEWHEEMSFGGGACTVLFLRCLNGVTLGQEEFDSKRKKWVHNPSVEWP